MEFNNREKIKIINNSNNMNEITEKKALYKPSINHAIDVGINIGCLSVTELSERWEMNKTYSYSKSESKSDAISNSEAGRLNVLLV